jgi:hypothetical protein
MAENGWKQVFDNTYLHNLLFYTQVCSIGQWVVFNYLRVSPKVLPTLVTPYSFRMGQIKIPCEQKWPKTVENRFSTIPPSPEWIVIKRLIRSHNNTPFGRPTSNRPIGHLGIGHSHGIFGVFSFIMIRALGGQSPAGLSAAWGLATLRVY